MWSSLSSGAISRILDGENVPAPIFQILGCKAIPGMGIDRYRLLISDGVTGCPFAMLGTQLSDMVTNKELEKFTIFRVDKYVCTEVGTNPKVIILLNLTVLVPGNEVNEKLGNPINSTPRNVPIVKGEVQQDSDCGALSNLTEDFKGMLPTLSSGAMDRILNGENVPAPIFQILGCKKIPGTGNDRYRLLISDGVTGCPFAMLGTQLGHMVTDNKLQKFTIVRVDQLVCNQVQADRKVIILLKLTVLAPGNEVNEKLGNPMNSASGNAPTTVEPTVNDRVLQENNSGPPEMGGSAPAAHPINPASVGKKWPTLSTGVLNRILDGQHVPSVTLQILECKKVPRTRSNQYQLLISDGDTCCPFGMLATSLSHLAINKELKKFTIVRVDKCLCNHVKGRKVIYLLDLAVLVPGNEVKEKLGNIVTENSINP